MDSKLNVRRAVVLGGLFIIAIIGVILVVKFYGTRPGFRIRHELRVKKTGFMLDKKLVDSTVAADSLKPFCADKETRQQWKLEADTGLTSNDFVNFLTWVSKVNLDCRGLFAMGEGPSPLMMQSPVPRSRDLYSFSPLDSMKPRLSLMVIASRSEIKFWTPDEWLPEIPLAMGKDGMEFVYSGNAANPVRTAWRDAMGRCLVEARKDRCTDSLWPNTKYVLLGDLSRLPDTIHPDSKKDMEWVTRGPLRRDVMLAAEIHAYRTMPGSFPIVRPYFHAILAPDLTWESTQRLLIALRHVGVDLNTIEIAR